MWLLERLSLSPEAWWFVLVVVAQITGVTLAAAMVTRSILQRRAAARHLLWLSAMACVLLSPGVAGMVAQFGWTLAAVPWTGVGPASNVKSVARATPEGNAESRVELDRPLPPRPVLDRRSSPNVRDRSAPNGPTPQSLPSNGPFAIEPRAVARSKEPEDSPGRYADRPVMIPEFQAEPNAHRGARACAGVLVLTWSAGVLFGLIRLAAAGRHLRRLGQSLEPINSSAHSVVLKAVGDALGGRELPPIHTSRAVAGPVALGVLRPRVVLPEGLTDSLSANQLRECSSTSAPTSYVATRS